MNKPSNTSCVVIPVYKQELTSNEIASLKQLMTVLSSTQFVLVCSEKLDLSNYIFIIKSFSNIQITEERFSPKFFSSVFGYNRLLLTSQFYKRFTAYKFILVYQLDAWIFKDELNYWCEQDYDYIGAPWFEGFNESNEEKQFIGVGNGGFSLRKVQSHLKVLNSFAYITSPKKIFNERVDEVKGFRSFFNQMKEFLIDVTIKNNTYHLFNNYRLNEDYFWGDLAPSKFSWFKVADVKNALQFSFECNPRKLYQMNNFQMPFGCHAWEKYEPDFWKDFIKVPVYN